MEKGERNVKRATTTTVALIARFAYKKKSYAKVQHARAHNANNKNEVELRNHQKITKTTSTSTMTNGTDEM